MENPDLSTWYPFHVSHWPKPIVDPADYDGGERLSLSWDLGIVSEKEKAKVIKDWCARLPELHNVRWLQIWCHTVQPLFDAACRMPNLECLQIKWSNVKKLDEIRRLQKLRYLFIGSSTKVESVVPLTALSGLRLLEIENFKLVSDFFPLASLTGLESLAVTGSIWSRQTVGSVEPFAQMTWLKSLSLDTSKIDSIRPLANLKHLQSLGMGGRLPMEEYAWLSAQLPNTESRWFSPYFDLAGTGHSPCKTCKNDSMVMLTGRGAKILCKICDIAKVQKHEAAFNAAKHLAHGQ
jgi:Leucine-rich repeat (LRR) protein